MNNKKLMRIFFMGEIFLFILFYYRGAHGLKAVHALQDENSVIEQMIQKEKTEIAQLEKEINIWQSDPFYKEKLAREKLHMARDGEEVYLL